MPGRSSGAGLSSAILHSKCRFHGGPLVPPTSFTCPDKGRPGSATILITTFCPTEICPRSSSPIFARNFPVLQIGDLGDRHAGPHLIAHLKQRQHHAEEQYIAAGVLLDRNIAVARAPAASWPRCSRAPSSPAIRLCRAPLPGCRSRPRWSLCGWPDCVAVASDDPSRHRARAYFRAPAVRAAAGSCRTSSSAVRTSLSALLNA